jgi:hypothetical protein
MQNLGLQFELWPSVTSLPNGSLSPSAQPKAKTRPCLCLSPALDRGGFDLTCEKGSKQKLKGTMGAFFFFCSFSCPHRHQWAVPGRPEERRREGIAVRDLAPSRRHPVYLEMSGKITNPIFQCSDLCTRKENFFR